MGKMGWINSHHTVDEKFTTVSVKHPYPSQYQYIELYYRKKDKEKNGWLLSPDNNNSSYIFVWVDKMNGTNSLDNIKKAEYLLITREKLIECILTSGLSEKILLSLVNIWKESDRGGLIKFDGISFICSHRGNKCSIGLLVDRYNLKRFSCFHKYYIK